MLPKKLRIQGKEYVVEEANDDATEAVFGLCLLEKLKIKVRKNLSKDDKVETLLHETIHALDRELKIKLNEDQVHRLSVGLFQVLKDNHQLRGVLDE